MEDRVRDLLEQIRSTAGVAADAAMDTARIAGKRAGQMVDVAKLNVQIFDLNGEFSDIMRQLGQVMYNTHKGELRGQENVSELLLRADETAGRIAELRARVSDLRQSRPCPACGAVCGRDDTFCRKCGGAL